MSYWDSERTKKYDIPLSHLDYKYVESCKDARELEKIVKTLRSGEEGAFPDLEKCAEDRLRKLKPDSGVLRKAEPLRNLGDLPRDERDRLGDDLSSWIEAMRVREECLTAADDDETEGGAGDASDKCLPPVRGNNQSFSSTPLPTKIDKSGAPKKTSVAPRDHRAWDRFDVDAELKKLDAEDEEKEKAAAEEGGGGGDGDSSDGRRKSSAAASLPRAIDVSGLTDAEKEAKATNEKNKGNESFAAADFEEAVLYYTRAISVKPTTPFYNNRALAYVKLKKWNRAIEDCDVVLRSERGNVKALLRRALARKEKKEWKKALNDVAVVFTTEPHNKRAIELKTAVEAALDEERKQREKDGMAAGRRMIIEEVESDEEEEEEEERGEEGEEEAEGGKVLEEEGRRGLEEVCEVDNKASDEITTSSAKKSKAATRKDDEEEGKKSTEIWDAEEVETKEETGGGEGGKTEEKVAEKSNKDTSNEAKKQRKREKKKEKKMEKRLAAENEEKRKMEESKVEEEEPPPLEDVTADLLSKFPKEMSEMLRRERGGEEECQRKGGSEKEAINRVASSSPPTPHSAPPSSTGPTSSAPSAASHPSPVEPTPEPALPGRVQRLKDEGNDAFKRGQYGAALDSYNRAVAALEEEAAAVVCESADSVAKEARDAAATSPASSLFARSLSTLLSNRSAAHLKIGDASSCIRDCDAAIALIPASPKAYLRRATAWEAKEKYANAYVDYQTASRIESSPSSSIAAAASNATWRLQRELREIHGNLWREKLPPMPTVGAAGAAPVSTASKEEATTDEKEEEATTDEKEEEATTNEKEEEATTNERTKKANCDGEKEEGATASSKRKMRSTPLIADSSPIPSSAEATSAISSSTSAPSFDDEKALGNAALKEGDLRSAMEHYTRCIALHPDNVVGFTNRALVNLKLGEDIADARDCRKSFVGDEKIREFYFGGAISDCDAALRLDARSVKAYFRRAKAKRALGRFKEAIEDVKALLKVTGAGG